MNFSFGDAWIPSPNIHIKCESPKGEGQDYRCRKGSNIAIQLSGRTLYLCKSHFSDMVRELQRIETEL